MVMSSRCLPSLVVALVLLAACGNSGSRVGGLCTPGADRCSENLFQTCASDGLSWVTEVDCVSKDLLCFTGQGCKKCSAGALQCGGDGFDITRCSSDGNR